jgi:serine/threonine-protein kinase
MIFSDGEIVQGRYQIRKQICGGTFGTTYHALDTQSGREVVIKVSDGGNDEERQSLEEELRILEKLNHPRLPKVFDWFWVNNQQRICMVMEYIPGTDVADYVNERRQKRCSPVMELPQVIGWICQVLDILAYLHRRQPDPIIHRDVKPENLRIHQDTGHIYLLDFGIAKSSNRTRMIGYGTPPYAPPEQYGGKGKTTPATDIYAVGVTMYVLLTGQDPPESLELERRKETLVLTHRYNPAIPAELEKIIHQAMHLDPAERYPDAQTMLKALEEVEIVRNLNQSGDYVTRLLSEEEDLDLLKEHITRLEEENKQLQKELEECAEERRNLHKLHQQSSSPVI